MAGSPNFTDPQFIDAAGTGGLNAAFGTVSGTIAALASGAFAYGGLLCPESMTVTPSGLTLNIGLPLPWGLIASGGVYNAHGTQTGLDTQNYAVSFAASVPASGSTTVWLVAQPTNVLQNPVPIPGPPPGHPSYNPNYQPVIGYTSNVNSVALSVSGAAPNNTSAFALLATTLTAGQSSITTYTTSGQARAGEYKATAPLVIAAGASLAPPQAQYMLEPATSGQSNTLPLSLLSAGLQFNFANSFASGSLTIACSGGDGIVGISGAVSGVSLVIPPYSAASLWTDGGGLWRVSASSPNAAGWTAGNITAISGAVVSGTTLLAANINGNAGTPFFVSGATASGQAVNLGQFPFTNAANGSQRIPGGLLMQWGSGTTTGGGAVAVTFQTVFNTVLSVTLGLVSTSPVNAYTGYGNLSVSGMTLYTNAAGAGLQLGTVTYIAIGT